MLDEISYLWYDLKLWVRETWLKLRGVNRDFYCQSDIESEGKCREQCEHCREYYKPLEELKKGL